MTRAEAERRGAARKIAMDMIAQAKRGNAGLVALSVATVETLLTLDALPDTGEADGWWPAESHHRPAYFTYVPKHGGAYYFAPSNRTPPPYREQRETTAILDIASDGTLAGVELVFGPLPAPPNTGEG